MKKHMTQGKGAVAAGHSLTAEAAEQVLSAGGNAYDAAIAAFFTACVAEPVLASLGGGGFLLSQTATGQQQVFDFFVHTPRLKRPLHEIDFSPIWADFGTTRQEFHIGQGSIATPGAVKGIFEVHRQLGSMPMMELIQPAIKCARQGLRVNSLQAYIFSIISPILMATPELAAVFSGPDQGTLIKEGESIAFPQLANTLEILTIEGDRLFYEGELAGEIVEQCISRGGHLRRDDLKTYRVISREPLTIHYAQHSVLTNPPPSSGGILIAFALKLWSQVSANIDTFGSLEHLQMLAGVMDLTNQARIEAHLDDGDTHLKKEVLLDEVLLARYRQHIKGRARALRGTTHISVIDQWRNVATVTLSNGEGCGSLVPGSGIMLNNMLGEEDINPRGFQQWHENQRMTSMMSPSIINHSDGSLLALGSGGSNRIRTAILQTVINLIDFDMALHDAVCRPRIHFENGWLNSERGFDADVLKALCSTDVEHKSWDALNLFFGGVHAVMCRKGVFDGVGDPRRGGVCRVV